MFRFEITATTLEEIDAQLKSLAELLRPTVNRCPQPVEAEIALKGLSLEEIQELVRARFDPEGYEVTIVDKAAAGEPDKSNGSGKKATTGKRGGRPSRMDATQAKRALAGEGEGDQSAPEEEPQAEAEAGAEGPTDADIKEDVIKRLLEMFANPKLKPKAKAFTDKVSKANGGKPVRDLPAKMFPQLQADMEEEFGSL